MTDPRVKKLADLLINYSLELKKGETVLIEAIDIPHAFTKALVESASKAGGNPLVMLKSNEITRALMNHGPVATWDTTANIERLQMQSAVLHRCPRIKQHFRTFRRSCRQAKGLRINRLEARASRNPD